MNLENEKIKDLERENKWLKKEVSFLKNPRIHFDTGDGTTACGLYDIYVDATDNFEEVTCRNCQKCWKEKK